MVSWQQILLTLHLLGYKFLWYWRTIFLKNFFFKHVKKIFPISVTNGHVCIICIITLCRFAKGTTTQFFSVRVRVKDFRPLLFEGEITQSIHWMVQYVLLTFTLWIVIYPLNSVICPLFNWFLWCFAVRLLDSSASLAKWEKCCHNCLLKVLWQSILN